MQHSPEIDPQVSWSRNMCEATCVVQCCVCRPCQSERHRSPWVWCRRRPAVDAGLWLVTSDDQPRSAVAPPTRRTHFAPVQFHIRTQLMSEQTAPLAKTSYSKHSTDGEIYLWDLSSSIINCIRLYTVSGKKRPPPKQNAVKCTVYYNTIQWHLHSII